MTGVGVTLQQLRYFCEVVRQGCNISRASATLHTSQPGVSKQMRQLEREVGAALFLRQRTRISGLTPTGYSVLEYARAAVSAADSIRRIAGDVSPQHGSHFRVGTTHTHARYALSGPVARFIKAHPNVQLHLRHGDPIQIATWVATNEVDLGITAEPMTSFADLVLIPCSQLGRIGLARRGHAFLREKRITLETIAKYPMITYDLAFTGRAQIAAAFARAGLAPQIVLDATDADVMKEYVRQGLGIAIVAENVFVPAEDRGLGVIDVSRLFLPHTVYVMLRKNAYLRKYTYDFIEFVASSLPRRAVDEIIARADG